MNFMPKETFYLKSTRRYVASSDVCQRITGSLQVLSSKLSAWLCATSLLICPSMPVFPFFVVTVPNTVSNHCGVHYSAHIKRQDGRKHCVA